MKNHANECCPLRAPAPLHSRKAARKGALIRTCPCWPSEPRLPASRNRRNGFLLLTSPSAAFVMAAWVDCDTMQSLVMHWACAVGELCFCHHGSHTVGNFTTNESVSQSHTLFSAPVILRMSPKHWCLPLVPILGSALWAFFLFAVSQSTFGGKNYFQKGMTQLQLMARI